MYRLSLFWRQGCLLLLLALPRTCSFTLTHIRRSTGTTTVVSQKIDSPALSAQSSNDNDDDDDNKNSNSDFEKTLYQSLQQRQQELASQHENLRQKWKEGDCHSQVAVVLDDWVRRIDVDYPLVACGSASGNLYVAHLETGAILAKTNKSRPSDIEERDESDSNDDKSPLDEQLEHALHILYGNFDGGGSIAIAFDNGLLVESERSGGVHLYRLDTKEKKLVSQGLLTHFGNDKIATVVHLDSEYLWVGTANGILQAYSLDEEADDDSGNINDVVSTAQPLALRRPTFEWKLEEAVTYLSLVPSENVGVVATASGLVHVILYSTSSASYNSRKSDNDTEKSILPEQRKPLSTLYPPWESNGRSSSNTYATSAMLVPQLSSSSHYALVCAGNEGSLFIQPVKLVEDSKGRTEIRFTRPLRPLRPSHFAAVPCLSSPSPGLFVSGGRDGKMRVWNLESSNENDKKEGLPRVYTGDSFTQDDYYNCVVQLLGYKVWLGSLWTNERYIVSDGSDNTIVTHTFGNAD